MCEKDVTLRREIFREDLEQLLKWVEDSDVNRYLNEQQGVGKELRKAIVKSQNSLFTHRLNQEGRFFLVEDADDDQPIGYLRVVNKATEGEIVVAIGEKDRWGQGLGKSSLWEGLKVAFFNMRLEGLYAKIHRKNKRSINLFKKLGFQPLDETEKEKIFYLSQDKFLELAVA